jgi:hypothetical protein
MILMLHLGRWMLSGMLAVSGEFSPTSLQGLPPYARQTKRFSEIIGVACRALGAHSRQRLMSTCTFRGENLLNTLWIAPKLRQNQREMDWQPGQAAEF